MADFLAGPITDPLPQRVTPASVTLVDAATIALDASQGDVFIAPITDNRTLAAPTNPKGGQRFNLIVKQPAAGGKTLTFDAAYTDVSGVVLNPLANGVTVLQFVTVVSAAGVFSHACVSSSTSSSLLSKLKSGTATIADGADNVVVNVGAIYDGKPVFVQLSTTSGSLSTAVQFKASIAGGNLTINPVSAAGATVAVTKAVGLFYLIDGR